MLSTKFKKMLHKLGSNMYQEYEIFWGKKKHQVEPNNDKWIKSHNDSIRQKFGRDNQIAVVESIIEKPSKNLD